VAVTEPLRGVRASRPTREELLAATPEQLVELVAELTAERDQLAELVKELEAERDGLAEALAEQQGAGY
jgi:uncharacterized coiled-coil DUF342 family protein